MSHASSRRALRFSLIFVLLVGLLSTAAVRAEAAVLTGAITGVAFKDLDRDALPSGEDPFADHRVYLFDSQGTYVKNALTDANGVYVFADLLPGRYEVRYSPASWWGIRADWVPTTTGTIFPRRWVDVDGTVIADFGWRPIVRSTDLAAPISEHVGPEGLRVLSYNDVVPASEIYGSVVRGVVGAEAPHVTVRFAYGSSDSTTASVGRSDGVYVGYRADVYTQYVTWLDSQDRVLAHEYGHAWSLYHAYMVQQDGSLAAYLEARGLTGDERLGTSYAWSPREMIAEDYRQLLGSATARLGFQSNRDIPPAGEVPGLEEFLRDVFTRASAPATPDPEPTVEPDPEPPVEPDPEPTVEPDPEPTDQPPADAEPTPEPTSSARPGKKNGGGTGAPAEENGNVNGNGKGKKDA